MPLGGDVENWVLGSGLRNKSAGLMMITGRRVRVYERSGAGSSGSWMRSD